MKSSGLILMGAALSVMVLAASAQAGEKTAVCVKFLLKESAYRGEFAKASQPTSPLLEELEARAAASLCARLEKNAGFLEYTTDDSVNYTLTFTLDCADSLATGMLKEVGIFAELTKPKTKTQIPYQMVRPAEAYEDRIGDINDVLLEIGLAIGNSIFLDNVRDEILKEVPVSEQGVVLADPVFGWLIPFTQQELKIDMGSEFLITNKVPSPLNQNNTIDYSGQASDIVTADAPVSLHQYINQLFCEPVSSQNHLDKLLRAVQAGKAAVLRIFIVDYRFLEMDTEVPDPPEESEF